ncbi:hypothetical protein KBX50_14780 [Micromonospora sp. C51]|uniref:Imm52 family immunity protein n=1 Tax=Micromonospora sp. C51 TaxID=2824879 RepID=UPI001B390D9F|nr:Imm52 family immunity protein [Micromonospora sp. C51]MBQ1049724.1 hypothetical protein [Micromonospora sp. C51]
MRRATTLARGKSHWITPEAFPGGVVPERPMGAGSRAVEGGGSGYREITLDDRQFLRQMIMEGANVDKPELGYGFGAWNGQGGELEVNFRAVAGQSASGLVNSARLEIRRQSQAEVSRWTAVVESLLLSLVRAFDPDYGMVWTHPMRQAQKVSPANPFAGYLTYLSRRRVRTLPASLKVKARLEEAGFLFSLVVPGRDWPGLEGVTRLGAEMKQAGLLNPVE